MKKKFYAVAGINGYGVYDNYKGVLKNREYVKSHRVKGFQTYAEAETYAYDTYSKLQEGQPDFYRIEKIDRINWFFRRENIHLHPLVKAEANINAKRKIYYGYKDQPMIKPFQIDIQTKSVE